MAHYAFLDRNNIVTEVIVGKNENEDNINWEQWYGNFRGQVCKQTSYNTIGGIHTNGGTPFRKNYAGIGYMFDEQRNAFIPPKPYASWILVEESCTWKAPVDMPTDWTIDNPYLWDENTISWIHQTT
jgi:hypothetical protein